MKENSDKHNVICPVCETEIHCRTKGEKTKLQRKIWREIKRLFMEAYDTLFIYGKN